MLFAGIYSDWMGPSGEEIDTAAIITVPANSDMKHLHERTPAILSRQQVRDWLDVGAVGATQAHNMLGPLPQGSATFRPVSTRVNGVKIDDQSLIVATTGDMPEPDSKKDGQLDLF